MKYTPPRTDKKFRAIYCTLLLCSVLCMGIRVEGILMPILSSIGLITLTAAVAMFIKYESITFVYVILERESVYDFYVDKYTGKRGAYVCYYPMCDAVKIVKVDSDTKSELIKKYGKISFYNYNKNMFTGEKYIIVFARDDGGYDAIKFEPDGAMLSLMNKLISSENN